MYGVQTLLATYGHLWLSMYVGSIKLLVAHVAPSAHLPIDSHFLWDGESTAAIWCKLGQNWMILYSMVLFHCIEYEMNNSWQLSCFALIRLCDWSYVVLFLNLTLSHHSCRYYIDNSYRYYIDTVDNWDSRFISAHRLSCWSCIIDIREGTGADILRVSVMWRHFLVGVVPCRDRMAAHRHCPAVTAPLTSPHIHRYANYIICARGPKKTCLL